VKPEIIRFLRSEAHKMYMGLDCIQRRLTNEQRIYLGLKKAWRAGSKLKVAQRGVAKGLPINFKDLDQLTRNLMVGAGKVDEVQAVERAEVLVNA